ncbi:MAG: response regulator [Armatimonadetes bacterium]|nr:response regulator [Armatimonadota bacterium]MBS1712401.1 response regulator [Armatimonadota bacterium]MBX3109290.1 response regulator [Fimbriimonadaceae bacterium]
MEKSKVLIIDDTFVGYSSIEEHLVLEEVVCTTEPDPRRGLEHIIADMPDILIIDVAYAGIDAWSLIDTVRRNKLIEDLPVVMVTGVADVEMRVRAYEMGADHVVTKPYSNAELTAIVRSMSKLNRFRKLAEQRNEIQKSLMAVQQAYDKTIQGWVKALDLRDHETEGHSVRVAQMTVHLARAFETPASDMQHIWRGALLHDIGKLAIPDAILRKRGPLTSEERRIMEKHPLHAHEMLYPVEYLRDSLPIPVYHHEKFDGTGYPFKIKGESIPLVARMFSVVDVWDALSFNRPYREAYPQDKVRGILAEGSGSHFDPDCVGLYLELLDYFDQNVPSISKIWNGAEGTAPMRPPEEAEKPAA